MRLGIIADVHGNVAALKAVLTDIRQRSLDQIVNLGDLVSGPFDPSKASKMQQDLNALTIAGNHERQVLNDPTSATDRFALGCLDDADLGWLASLPPSIWVNDDIFACHGSPAGGDTDYLLEDVSGGWPQLAPVQAIRTRLARAGRKASIVLCAHTHVARVVRIDDTLVVNPGSVGWPAYRDVSPVPHAIENGSPHARYAVLTTAASGATVELHAVDYAWTEAADQAQRNGRPDVAFQIRTGRVADE